MTPEQEKYLAAHDASKIHVGDSVRVVRAADMYELGWNNSWEDSMTLQIGKVLAVIRDDRECGFTLSHGYDYPYFVLEKVVV